MMLASTAFWPKASLGFGFNLARFPENSIANTQGVWLSHRCRHPGENGSQVHHIKGAPADTVELHDKCVNVEGPAAKMANEIPGQ
jgi:hypothetical protein